MTVYGTTYQNLTPGTALTGNTSGGNSGFSAVSSTLVAATLDGAVCAQATNPGTANVIGRRTASSELATKAKWLVPFVGRIPNIDWQIARINWGTAVGTDSGLAMHVSISTAGKLKITTQGSGTAIIRLNASLNTAIVAGAKYQLEVYLQTDGTATGGSIHVVLYQYGTSTVVGDNTFSVSGIDLGVGGGFTNFIALKNSGDTETGTVTLLPGTALKTQADAVDAAEPYGVSAPTVSAGAAQNVTPGASVALAASVGGGVAPFTYAWGFDYPSSGAPALSSTTVANPTFTAPPSAGQLAIARVTVTDANGATATATVEVRTQLAAAGTEMRPLTASIPTMVGSWTAVGATGNAVLADESDTTYYETPPVTATEVSIRSRYQPSVNRSDGTVGLRLSKSDSGSLTFTVRLFIGPQSTQVIDSWTVAPTTTPTDYAHTLSAATIAAITNAADGWSQLRVEIAATS